MNNQNDLRSLKQIYYFVDSLPELPKLTDFDKTVEFFRSLHYGEASEFDVKVNQITGNFGKKKVIILKETPNFSNSNVFLSWVVKTLTD
ncbi:hypothetical protein [Acinetobacter wuhouensis]|uniref:Uncharacterized protein n=1 Tax=Acinetobacter wuhouensis TaxID=1879050 RepID=A0A3G2T288_9GAMM|nr:hypothetical protein [Acinetobacter wuhouensis]AYO54181.1 hypothetical protein CDG68_11275 [Acinetobacter wuhouensis]RZG48082.1 hypothetical protein EXU28_04765 [Acinetobacter wuhouensis]